MSTQAPLALEQDVAETVAALARTLYPHVALPDTVYARVPAKIDEAAREDAEQARMVAQGVADLDGRGSQPFRQRTAEQQLADAKAIAGSDFFELVRSTAVVEIYSDPSVEAAGLRGSRVRAGRPHQSRLQRPRLAPRPRPRAGGVSDAAFR
jgi:hypothetical protein